MGIKSSTFSGYSASEGVADTTDAEGFEGWDHRSQCNISTLLSLFNMKQVLSGMRPL